MNYRMILYIIGKMLGVEGIVLLLPALVALIYREPSGIWFLVVSAVLGLLFFLTGKTVPKNRTIYGKEGFAVVGFGWFVPSVCGALLGLLWKLLVPAQTK